MYIIIILISISMSVAMAVGLDMVGVYTNKSSSLNSNIHTSNKELMVMKGKSQQISCTNPTGS